MDKDHYLYEAYNNISIERIRDNTVKVKPKYHNCINLKIQLDKNTTYDKEYDNVTKIIVITLADNTRHLFITRKDAYSEKPIEEVLEYERKEQLLLYPVKYEMETVTVIIKLT